MLEEQAQARLTFFTQGLDLLTYFSRNFFLGGVSPCQTLPNFVLQSLPDLLLQFPCSGLVIKPQLKDNICLLVGPGPKCQDVEKMLNSFPAMLELDVLDVNTEVIYELGQHIPSTTQVPVQAFIGNVMNMQFLRTNSIHLSLDVGVADKLFFRDSQLVKMAGEVARVLSPGGVHFSLPAGRSPIFWKDYYPQNTMHMLLKPDQSYHRWQSLQISYKL